MTRYPPEWADEPSDQRCGCGARAVIVYGWSPRRVLACSDTGMTTSVCPKESSDDND